VATAHDDAIGAYRGQTVLFIGTENRRKATIVELAPERSTAGQGRNLVRPCSCGRGNPAITRRRDCGIGLLCVTPQSKATKCSHELARKYEDETFAKCDWHLPAAHYLESCGRCPDEPGLANTRANKPLIAPLFGGGITECEVLARITGRITYQQRL